MLPYKVKKVSNDIIKRFNLSDIKLISLQNNAEHCSYIFGNRNTKIIIFYHRKNPYGIACLRDEEAYLDRLYLSGTKINGPALRRLGLK
ncbi:MAG: hypothetical protein ACFFDH_13565 [Promethearchaeota archaeon]